jgi:ribosome-associated translation inhibitor RaiA
MDIEFPLEIVIRDIPRTDGLENRIREKVAKLAALFPRITRARVVVESPAHHHHNKGAVYQCHIELGVPGPEIVVTRESERDQQHADLNVALRDAFDAARRQLQDRLDKWRNHPPVAKGELPGPTPEPAD